ncbi:MAG: porin family protein [Ignavibacteria bacterium]|nr:porin family protein [Ignavibacteria bacterium]
MFRWLFAFLFVLTVIPAQGNSASIKLGYFNPSATDGGFIVGYEGSRIIDEYFSIGWSVDWFNKNYVDQSLAREFDKVYGVEVTTNELRAKTNLHHIPLLFTATASFPAGARLRAYITGGIGGEVLLIYYRNFRNPDDDDLQALFDFSWRLGAGVAYELGSRSDLIAELTYHSSAPSWEYEITDAGGNKRIFIREFDMSGLMLRAGVKFYF